MSAPIINSKPELEPWIRPKETTASLDWAPLPIIDFSKFYVPGGKASLAEDLKDAVRRWGFWMVVGAGIPQDLINRQFTIRKGFFRLPIEEKRKVACDFAAGSNFGYNEPVRYVGNDTKVKENMENLSIPKFTDDYASIPQHDFIRAFHDEIGPFHWMVWDKVVRRLFILMAIMLELPENYFVDRHAYDKPSEDVLRCLLYHPRPTEDDEKIGGVWNGGHTDFGTLTLLFSQSIAALQLRTPDNEWKWVKPVEGAITCNAGDTLSFLTKGYIKSTIHRVIRPPPDQASLERYALGYFCRPGNDVPMVPAPSPVLRREEFLTEEDEKLAAESDVVTGFEYIRARVKYVYDRKVLFTADKKEDAVFKLKSLAVKDYYL